MNQAGLARGLLLLPSQTVVPARKSGSSQVKGLGLQEVPGTHSERSGWLLLPCSTPGQMCLGNGDGTGRLLLGATIAEGRDLSFTQTPAQAAHRGHGVSTSINYTVLGNLL